MVLSWAGTVAVGAVQMLGIPLEKRAGLLTVAMAVGLFTAWMSTDWCMWQCCREQYLKEFTIHTTINSVLHFTFGLVMRNVSGDKQMPAVEEHVDLSQTDVKSGASAPIYHITTFT